MVLIWFPTSRGPSRLPGYISRRTVHILRNHEYFADAFLNGMLNPDATEGLRMSQAALNDSSGGRYRHDSNRESGGGKGLT